MKFPVGPGVACDLVHLTASRLLVQANSGAGKTRTLRRILEQTHGHIQQLVLDPEGEYHTLRERFDYVLAAAKDGDTIAHPKTAAVLAERLLQLRVSAILDIYELNPDARKAFVANFLTALVDAPRDLWHPVLVILDEAHVYAPERGQGEAISSEAVKALATRGRKRGYCLVPATQRLSKLHKDIAAECNNKLIGRCAVDVDMKRAAEELGFTTREQAQSLRQLEPGEFFAFGPAFDIREPRMVKVGAVQTRHQEPGQQAVPVQAPTDKVRKILAKLADLPAEVEQREKSLADLRRENVDLKRQLRAQPKAPEPVTKTKTVERKVVTEAQLKRVEKSAGYLQAAIDKVSGDLVAQVRTSVDALIQSMKDASPITVTATGTTAAPPEMRRAYKATQSTTAATRRTVVDVTAHGPIGLPPGERAILVAAAQHGSITREHLTVLTGYKRSSRNSYLQRLSSRGYIVTAADGTIAPTIEGLNALGPYEPLPTGERLRQHWRERLPIGESTLFETIAAFYPNVVDRDELDSAGYKRSARNSYLQRLAVRGLITRVGGGVRAAESLFA